MALVVHGEVAFINREELITTRDLAVVLRTALVDVLNDGIWSCLARISIVLNIGHEHGFTRREEIGTERAGLLGDKTADLGVWPIHGYTCDCRLDLALAGTASDGSGGVAHDCGLRSYRSVRGQPTVEAEVDGAFGSVVTTASDHDRRGR